MGPVFYIFLGILIAWFFMGRRSCRRRTRLAGPDPRPDGRDEIIERLNERVRTLERIITDRDWQLRRDIDDLDS
ncbi:hypothetical protein [Hyphomonas sp.]|uniref:hypothetical protein n=1 Tax=Hyphomonas sp. TaxID=87 RepID=UPI00391A2939